MNTEGARNDPAFVSRGGLKLHHAIVEFGRSSHPLDVRGMICADFGASTGGFTDCLIRHGAARVYAIDTAYGQLAWSLRNDPRVVVMERANCLHIIPPADLIARGGVDLVVADAGWTPQRLLLPAALKWLNAHGRIITLIKPHYELKDAGGTLPHRGVLSESESRAVVERVVEGLPKLGVRLLALTPSPITGSAKGKGNMEWLALLDRPET